MKSVRIERKRKNDKVTRAFCEKEVQGRKEEEPAESDA